MTKWAVFWDTVYTGTHFIRVFLEVHVGVVVSVNQFKLKLVQFEHCADVHVTQRVVFAEFDRVARLVGFLHAASLQELTASETYVQRKALNGVYCVNNLFTKPAAELYTEQHEVFVETGFI